MSKLRTNLYLLELLELTIVGLVLATLMNVVAPNVGENPSQTNALMMVVVPLLLIGCWFLYMTYIKIARAGGKVVDILLWVGASIATASFTFWCWTILDLNRFILAKALYRGAVPVEYAWSHASKQRRKVWNAQQRALVRPSVALS
jgi:hypothetical protein